MAPPARLRVWFLRNLLEAVEREVGAAAVAELPGRVPARVREHVSLERLRASGLDAIPLEEGEDAVLALEQALGDSSGRLLERVACDMMSRQLVQAAATVRVGDLFATVARLRAPLEHPFVDAPISFELTRTPTGFRLSVAVSGRPRATRLLAYFAAGAIGAAERFARETHADPLRVEVETVADRARVEARFRRASTAPPPAPAPLSLRRASSSTTRIPSLSDEVERILGPSALGERRAASDDGARKASGQEIFERVTVVPEPDAGSVRFRSEPPPRVTEATARPRSQPPPRPVSEPPARRSEQPASDPPAADDGGWRKPRPT